MIKPAKDSLDLGIIVSDIKASLDFYQKTLGLEFVGITPLWFGTMHRLRFGTSDFKLIEHKLTFIVKNINFFISFLTGLVAISSVYKMYFAS